MNRRDLIKGAATAAVGAAIYRPAVAQNAWPAKGRVVKVIVPWPPGAANDALGRLVAQRFQEKFGVSAIVENRTGIAPLVCVMTGDRPQKTVSEVVSAAKADPGNWNFAISATGSAGHLATIDFLQRTG